MGILTGTQLKQTQRDEHQKGVLNKKCPVALLYLENEKTKLKENMGWHDFVMKSHLNVATVWTCANKVYSTLSDYMSLVIPHVRIMKEDALVTGAFKC